METCFYLFIFLLSNVNLSQTYNSLDLNSLPHKLISGCHFQIFVLDNQCTFKRVQIGY